STSSSYLEDLVHRQDPGNVNGPEREARCCAASEKSMIVIQKLVTRWTKASRGGSAAARRNATPLASMLPPPPRGTHGVFLHTLTFDEAASFVPMTSFEVLELDDALEHIRDLQVRTEAD